MKDKLNKFWKENRFYLLFLLIVVVVSNYRLPYYVSAPGGIIDISDRIEMDERVVYDGSLNMLYVTQYEATIPLYLMSFILKDWDLESIKTNQISNENHKEIDIRNKIMLNNSVNNAIYVAYTASGKDIRGNDGDNGYLKTTYEGIELASDEFIQDCQLDLFGYKVTDGLITDVVTLKQRGLNIACCNISCGYYNPHTDYESSKISDIEKCWEFTKHILSLENTYEHKYIPKIVTVVKVPKMLGTNITKSTKLQEAYAKRIINKNLGLSDSDLVTLWIEHRPKFPSISLIQFKHLYNEKNPNKIS